MIIFCMTERMGTVKKFFTETFTMKVVETKKVDYFGNLYIAKFSSQNPTRERPWWRSKRFFIFFARGYHQLAQLFLGDVSGNPRPFNHPPPVATTANKKVLLKGRRIFV